MILTSLSGCQRNPTYTAGIDGCFIDEDGDGYGVLEVTGDCSDPDAVPEPEPEPEAEDDDGGITVDEDGVEWYEDDEGSWWYRDPGEPDWVLHEE